MDEIRMTLDAALEVRDVGRREVALRLFRWGEVGHPPTGPEMIERSAIEAADPTRVRLRMDHANPAAGRGQAWELRDDGPWLVSKVSKTARGDELLTTALDGTYDQASVGFLPIEGSYQYRSIGGERVRVHSAIDLREASTTWIGAYQGSALEVRARNGGAGMPETTTPETPATTTPETPATTPTAADPPAYLATLDRIAERIDRLEERSRQSAIDVPAARTLEGLLERRGDYVLSETAGRWASIALASIAGERVPDIELRALADVITSGNLGAVPASVRTELIGIIDPARPFLESTREVPAGDSGMKITFPKITQRPIVGKQATEKAEVASQTTAITTVEYSGETWAGAGDLSIQLLRRSSPEFLNLWLELLAEDFGIKTDNAAVDALLAEAAVVEGGVLDPEAPAFGSAFTNAAAVSKSALLRPNRMWLSTAALVAFIDAKEPAGGGGRALYPGLASISSVDGGGAGGPAPMTLRPVWVPALDDEAVDILIGPSRGFAWAQDGTFQLQADVPAKMGRDVGLGGIMWFMPIYPAAFTSYTLPV